MSTLTDVAMWSKAHPAWGSRRRIQRNHYAYLVTLALTGGKCAAGCGNDLDLDSGEVDRAIPRLDYRPGNIAYVCHGCNHGRGILQSNGRDWQGVSEYANDIRLASYDVRIPSEAEARIWWAHRPTAVTHPRYA